MAPWVTQRHHYHGCQACQHVWDHDPPARSATEDEVTAAHICPKCNAGPFSFACEDEREARLVAHKHAAINRIIQARDLNSPTDMDRLIESIFRGDDET